MSKPLLTLLALGALLLAALAWWWPEANVGGAVGPGARSEEGPVLRGALPEVPEAEPTGSDSPGAPAEDTRVQLASSGEDSPMVLVEPPWPVEAGEGIELEIAGDVSGRLVSESGAWTPDQLPARDTLVVELMRLEEPRLERRAELSFSEDEQGGLTLSFLFEDVPVGEYELSLFHLGSWHWEPASMRVRPPATGLDFVRYDRDEVLPLAFEVIDARTGEALEDYSVRHLEQTVSAESGVFMHAGPLDAEAFPRQASFRWSLWAEGYRARFGDEGDFVETGSRRVARVELERGPSVAPTPAAARPPPQLELSFEVC